MLKNLGCKVKQQKNKWLVTGCAGFIGSNLIEFLLQNSQVVIGLDNFSTGKKKNLDDVKSNVGSENWKQFSFIEGDIKDPDTCREATSGVDFVLHQAALGSVPRSINDPLTSHINNVNGHLNMLLAARDNKVKSFVYASSSSVYGDHPGLPKVEGITGNPLSPYAVTKSVNELYSRVFTMQYGIKTIGIRYFNVFGKRQDPDSVYAAVIPKWVKAMLDGEVVSIFGDGETSRDFCYIDNVIQFNVMAALSQNESAFGLVYNCACGDRTDLNTLFCLIRDGLTSNNENLKELKPVYKDFRAGDVKHSHANISLGQKNLGYEPLYSIKDGLKESLDWYIKNL